MQYQEVDLNEKHVLIESQEYYFTGTYDEAVQLLYKYSYELADLKKINEQLKAKLKELDISS